MDWTWAQILSVTSVGLLIYLIVGASVVLFFPLPMGKTRALCVSGVSAVLILSVNTGVLYFWHHYFRV